MSGKRERNKEANRAAILEAAQRVFLDRGSEAVTIRDVIGETDLASGTFYNYFRTKQDLLRALVEEHIEDLTAQLHEVRGQARSLDEFIHGAYLAAFTKIAGRRRLGYQFFAKAQVDTILQRRAFMWIPALLISALHHSYVHDRERKKNSAQVKHISDVFYMTRGRSAAIAPRGSRR